MALEVAIYLIPVTLGDTPIDQVLPPHNRDVIVGIRHFVVENIRSARRFLKKVEPSIDIDQLTFFELNQHTDRKSIDSYLQPIVQQKVPMGIISEAGCPAVADPGADLVAIAQRKGLKVVPLVGPSSMIMSVMASGLNGQSFAFNGYLPIDDDKRVQRLKQLEARAWSEDQTQLFIETPYRNQRMMQTLLGTLRPQSRVCLASNITCPDESIKTHSVAEWKQLMKGKTEEQMNQLVPRVPSIFLIYKG
ncbi:MAG: SAM-dependent methyltransferase [Bacteroidales bacterium]|nr:SAM-dependent methyltransferase [Bacteroidales bacterium]